MLSLWSLTSLFAWLFWRAIGVLCRIVRRPEVAVRMRARAERAMTLVEYWDPPPFSGVPGIHPRRLPLELWVRYESVGNLYGGVVAVRENGRMFHVYPDMMIRAYPHDFEWVGDFRKGSAAASEGDERFPIDINGNRIYEQPELPLAISEA